MPPKWSKRVENCKFLSEPRLELQNYIDNLTPKQRVYFFGQCKHRLLRYKTFRRLSQGTPDWLACKQECCTGSIGPSMVGHNEHEPPLKTRDHMLHPEDRDEKDNSFSKFMKEHGHKTEEIARKDYQKEVENALQIVFDSYEGNFPVNHAGLPYILFCNIQLPIHNHCVPKIHIEVNGFVLDLNMPWRGVSLDGIVYVDGIPRWIVEIKCPVAKQYALWVLFKTCYYDQLMNNLHCIRQHHPTVEFCHVYVYSVQEMGRRCSFMEPFYFDAAYFYEWYMPRELHFYFTQFLPLRVDEEPELRDQSTISTSIQSWSEMGEQLLSHHPSPRRKNKFLCSHDQDLPVELRNLVDDYIGAHVSLLRTVSKRQMEEVRSSHKRCWFQPIDVTQLSSYDDEREDDLSEAPPSTKQRRFIQFRPVADGQTSAVL